MRIGLDFDNTIVSYDHVFHLTATKLGLIPAEVQSSKVAVRDYLRSHSREHHWTELQGIVYGSRMADAVPFPGVLGILRRLNDAGHELFIVSHKTTRPYQGSAYDLHKAAFDWIAARLRDESGQLIATENVCFCERKEEKVASVDSMSCDIFVDDLPEILLAADFPSRTYCVLFDPEELHNPSDAFDTAHSWHEIGCLIGCYVDAAP